MTEFEKEAEYYINLAKLNGNGKVDLKGASISKNAENIMLQYGYFGGSTIDGDNPFFKLTPEGIERWNKQKNNRNTKCISIILLIVTIIATLCTIATLIS
ncbi:MAG: hypothetical protein ACK5LF_21390 [Bacteroides xylanisolvens]